MELYEFKEWLKNNSYSEKMQRDAISRIKKVEQVCGYIDIDQEYKKDRCTYVLSLFRKKGLNEDMEKLEHNTLPIGKYYLSAYKYAVTLYIKFIIDKNSYLK